MLIKECSNINTEILITEMGVSNEAKNVKIRHTPK
jgi:hypothetical protein